MRFPLGCLVVVALAGCFNGCPSTWTDVRSESLIHASFDDTSGVLVERLQADGFDVTRLTGRPGLSATHGNLTLTAHAAGHWASRTNVTWVEENATELRFVIDVEDVPRDWGFEAETASSRAWAQPIIDGLHDRLTNGTGWAAPRPSPTQASGYVC
jgi:hypothetical protein